jgi:hypothetical protein
MAFMAVSSFERHEASLQPIAAWRVLKIAVGEEFAGEMAIP